MHEFTPREKRGLQFKAATHPDLWSVSLDGSPRKVASNGYVNVRVLPGVWEAEHRMVLAQMLGRPLRLDESPHHRNGDTQDNRPENLELWTNGTRRGQRASECVSCPSCGARLSLSTGG